MPLLFPKNPSIHSNRIDTCTKYAYSLVTTSRLAYYEPMLSLSRVYRLVFPPDYRIINFNVTHFQECVNCDINFIWLVCGKISVRDSVDILRGGKEEVRWEMFDPLGILREEDPDHMSGFFQPLIYHYHNPYVGGAKWRLRLAGGWKTPGMTSNVTD